VSRVCGPLLLALAAMAQSQKLPLAMPPTGQDIPTGHGVIEGTVVDAATHEPLKKAKVTIGVPRQTPPTAFTDASGRFVFRELPAGGYWLSVSRSGYNQAQDAFGADSNLQISLGADETKKGVEIALVPDGTISGRVLNEDGLPVRNCSVTAVQPGYEQGRRVLRRVADGTGTDDKGGYRVSGLAPGRYYLFVHCRAELPAAHPLLPRGDPRTPHENYVPQFYGGGLDPATATRLAVAAGAGLDGIDFEIRRTRAFALRGSITTADPEGFPDNVNVILYPANPLLRNVMQFGAASTNTHSRTFQIRSVVPGSYRLIAFSRSEGHSAYAERMVEVGAAPPGPIDLALTAGTDLKGSVQFDAEDHPPQYENAQIVLVARERSGYMPQPRGEINKDGTFTLASVVPGHWRLMLRAFGYVKSLSLAGQQLSPYDFQIPPGATGPLHVLMGLKMAEISVTVTGLSGRGQASVLVYPEDLDRLGAGLEQVTMGSGQLGIGNLPPGRYRLLATDAPNLWNLEQRPDLLQAIEGSTQAIDVPEGGRVSATVELVPREELLRVLAEKEQ
jgi:hypothetical protein